MRTLMALAEAAFGSVGGVTKAVRTGQGVEALLQVGRVGAASAARLSSSCCGRLAPMMGAVMAGLASTIRERASIDLPDSAAIERS